ncbi:ParB/RepB/Spo0J family partition protein [Pseudophaeobacter leonis]|uniref:ParB/RepB/Spo0J family partition protein n=1 Tax=Pseudophaeobacter leonis TaxID=1144477 RepID=UPI001374832F|nr:ParB N-terminal domain-containing protein [Pseudophaeobacter leonis]
MARKAPIKKPVPTGSSATETKRPKLRGGPLAVAADGQVAAMREEIDAARSSVGDRYQDGSLVLRLSVDQIIDEVGTDRLQEFGSDDQFNDLRASIEARGQTQPIRLRPALSDWTPDAAGRARPDDKFILQSGRRRLAVCKLLNRDVLAIVSAVTEGDETREDLIERFEENTVRADLSAFERYLSIGQIAATMPDASQSQVSDLLNVQRPEVSVGQSVWQYQRELLEFSDGAVKDMPQVKIRGLVASVKSWVDAGKPKVEQPREASTEVVEYRRKGAVTAVTAKRRGKKMVLEFDAGAGEADVSEALQLFLKAHFAEGD